jgi:histidinol-phosphate aminotransferase
VRAQPDRRAPEHGADSERDADLEHQPDLERQPDLEHHGDREVGPGLVDLAVNVRLPAPPAWLEAALAAELGSLGRYPDAAAATVAVAARHRRPAEEVLVTAGAAEAFTLLARALRPGREVRRAVVLHPQFTEPELALHRAGHRVERVLSTAEGGFRIGPDAVPADADLVVLGNPTNPTSVLHPAVVLRRLARPGRVLVVDEAFMDAVPGEPESLAGDRELPGLVVVRSLTKTWGLAGLRAGYLLGPAPVVARCAQAQPHWSVSSLALRATELCCAPDAVAEAARRAREQAPDCERLVGVLRGHGAFIVGEPAAPFVLARFPDAARLRLALRAGGFAVRRADTFPGLGPQWLRVAVRDRAVTDALSVALSAALSVAPARVAGREGPR